MWKPTPKQRHAVDLLIASAECRERELRDRIKQREMMFNATPIEPPVISTIKPKAAPVLPHQCKVDYRTTTDQDGRVWRVEYRH